MWSGQGFYRVYRRICFITERVLAVWALFSLLPSYCKFAIPSSHSSKVREMEPLERNPNSVNKLSESSSASVDDDDPPVLSSQALAALKEFLAEQNHSVADSDVETGRDSEVALVAEDWRLSQFWYSAETAKTLAEEVLALCERIVDSRVACIACPTLYAYLKVIPDFDLDFVFSGCESVSLLLLLCQ